MVGVVGMLGLAWSVHFPGTLTITKEGKEKTREREREKGREREIGR